MTIRTGRAAVTAALLGVLTLSACDGSPPDASPEASGASGSIASPGAQGDVLLKSPLQAYRLTPTEAATVSHARAILIARCAARFGFDYPVNSFEEDLARQRAGERLALGRIYGITDREVASEYGYGLRAKSEETDPDFKPGPAFLTVLKGRTSLAPGSGGASVEVDGLKIPAEGCVGEAERKIGGDPDTSSYGLGHTMWIQAMNEVIASEQYRAIVNDWVGCLADGGYRVTDPSSDRADIERLRDAGSGQGKATEAEIALALADIDCKEKVDLVDRLDEISADIADKLIEKHQLDLDEDRKRLDRQLALATKLVEEGS